MLKKVILRSEIFLKLAAMAACLNSDKPKYQTNHNQMEAQKVDMFIMANGKFFESYEIANIRDRMLEADESKWAQVSSLQFKDPTTILIVSILAGNFGIDRFMLGDTGMGIGKLLTCGGLGIWTIIDWFMIQPATREKNTFKIRQHLR